MIGDPLLVVVVGMSALSVGGIALGQLFRGRRRIVTLRYGTYIAIPSVTAALVLVPLRLNLSFSDALAVAGLIVSVAFGLAAGAMEWLRLRLRIGILIPSAVPFHMELREGFRSSLTQLRAAIYDDYLISHRASENLTEFLPALRRTLRWRPDYLVVCSPAVALWSNAHVRELITHFSSMGGGIVFIDNEPIEDVTRRLGPRFGMVTSDVDTGARLIAQYIRDRLRPGQKVLVLCGPPSSAPAEIRRKALAAELPDATLLIADSGGWGERSTYSATLANYQTDTRFVICGNDVMAFGAVRAIREIEKREQPRRELDVEVIGYDGIARALVAIWMVDNPFAVTVRTPPSAYGDEIAAMILRDCTSPFRSRLVHSVIPVTEGQLITRNNIDMVMEA